MRKFVFPQESNLQPLDYRSTALPLQRDKTSFCMLDFGYLSETSSVAHLGEQRTGNPKAAGLIPAGTQLFRIACF